MMASKRPGSILASRSSRMSACTLPTVMDSHEPSEVSCARSMAHESPVTAAILSLAWSSSSPRWASTSVRPPFDAMRSATLANTTVFPVPVA